MFRRLIVCLALCSIVLVGCEKKAEKPAAKVGPKLPSFTLKDPLGKAWSSKELVKGGLVIVATAPTLSQEKSQRGWSDYLEESKPKNAHLVFLEDMSATHFDGMAKSSMRKDYKEGDPVILLLDENGDLRAKLGAKKGKTTVFVYNDDGTRIAIDHSTPSAAGAKTIWAKLK